MVQVTPYGPDSETDEWTIVYDPSLGCDSQGKDAEDARSLSVCACRGCGWMNQHQQQKIEYLREENRVLREQLGDVACASMMTSVVA
jgi:hypothetical protein